MPEPEVPPGHVLIRLADLAAIIAARPAQPSPGAAPAGPHRQPGDAWSGLGAAVAMCTAHLGENRDLGHRQLAQGIPPELIIAPLVAMAAAGLRGCLEGGAEAFLRDMGLIAAARGRGPDGELLGPHRRPCRGNAMEGETRLRGPAAGAAPREPHGHGNARTVRTTWPYEHPQQRTRQPHASAQLRSLQPAASPETPYEPEVPGRQAPGEHQGPWEHSPNARVPVNDDSHR